MVLTGLGLTSNREMGARIIRNYLRKLRKISELRRGIVKWHGSSPNYVGLTERRIHAWIGYHNIEVDLIVKTIWNLSNDLH